jgi:hypothetical protein
MLIFYFSIRPRGAGIRRLKASNLIFELKSKGAERPFFWLTKYLVMRIVALNISNPGSKY